MEVDPKRISREIRRKYEKEILMFREYLDICLEAESEGGWEYPIRIFKKE